VEELQKLTVTKKALTWRRKREILMEIILDEYRPSAERIRGRATGESG
jgi:hypothetical protein